MGKNRVNSAVLTKSYSSTSAQAGQDRAARKATLSVAEKLSQLRLEGLKHERKVSSRNQLGPSPVHSAIQGDPEVAAILGREYVSPLPRVKPRSRGHLAPKSWDQAHGASRQKLPGQQMQSLAVALKSSSLVDLCLKLISSRINEFTGCGMQYLPAHIRSILLSTLDTNGSNDAVWKDLVPIAEEVDDALTWLDISRTTASATTLKRLGGIRSATLSVHQVDNGLVFAFPSVLREISIDLDNGPSIDFQIRKAQWRRLATHFVALRHVILLFNRAIDDLDASACISSLDLLDSAPDWQECFATVTQITLITSIINPRIQNDIYHAFTQVRENITGKRKRGKHIDFQIMEQ